MLEFVRGDFFDFDADIRVNTVNCVGVMGAGVALAFKKKYPDMFKDYAKKCKEGVIRPGAPTVWKSSDMFSKGVEIVNFPTKDDWRNPSKYEYIESGLKWFSEYLSQKGDVTVTLPALGCGHGGLDWDIVKSLIKTYLGNSSSKILVFEPFSSKNAGKQSSSLPEEKRRELLSGSIETVGSGSKSYPERLRRYTEKDIYFSGRAGLTSKFDITIISSSKPGEPERKAIELLVEYIVNKKYSILFGGSAADKKLALEATSKGIKVGVFLPSGILSSARKIKDIKGGSMLILLSIGDPYDSFDRKAYMPSVLSRVYLSDLVIFTTDKFDWILKHKKALQDSGAEFFHIDYADSSAVYDVAINELKSKPIDISKVPNSLFIIDL